MPALHAPLATHPILRSTLTPCPVHYTLRVQHRRPPPCHSRHRSATLHARLRAHNSGLRRRRQRGDAQPSGRDVPGPLTARRLRCGDREAGREAGRRGGVAHCVLVVLV